MIFKKILNFFGFLEQKEDDEDVDLYSVDDRIKETLEHYELHQKHIERYADDVNLSSKNDSKAGYKIRFEFIPASQNFINARSYLQYQSGSFKSWQVIRNKIEDKSNAVCCICSSTSQIFDENETTKTQCHEVWQYDDKKKIQKLIELQALCVRCHNIKHINRFYKNEDKSAREALLNQYAKLNNIDIEKAQADFEEEKEKNKKREDILYSLDLYYLNSLNLNDIDVDEIFNPHNHHFRKFLENYFKKNKNIEE